LEDQNAQNVTLGSRLEVQINHVGNLIVKHSDQSMNALLVKKDFIYKKAQAYALKIAQLSTKN